MSPSIHPLPSVPRPAGAVALPSGLGAGGRGKEKAPCRYLHYEVDITPVQTQGNVDGEEELYHRKEEKPKRTHRIELGLGPVGKGYEVVSPTSQSGCRSRLMFTCSFHLNGSTVIFVNLIVLSSENST
jgi:mRNA m6A methyltransferase catalytic subunit